MRRIITLMILIITSFFSLSFDLFGFSTEGGGHATILGVGISTVAAEHQAETDFERWVKEATAGNPGNLFTGAFDEDCTPINRGAMQELPIPGTPRPTGPNGWGNFFEHFFNPRTGAGLGSNRTAIARAEEYERKIIDLICSTHTRYDQLDEFSRKKVNDYFGRLMHLLQDMGMSYHSKLEIHPFKWDKPLEYYVEANWETIKDSDLYKEESSNTKYWKGICIDPTVPMFRLAQWSNALPANYEYQECISLPSEYCELKTQMVANYATRMSARATKFTEGYIDQIWNAIKSDCICYPSAPGIGRGQPDDTFSVNDSFLGTTQLDLSSDNRLNFFLRLALKKGDISPLYTKQLIEVYVEAQTLSPDAPQEAKDDIKSRFQQLLATLNNLPAKNQNDWPDIALLDNGYYDEALALFNKAQEPVRFVSPDFSPSLLEGQPIFVIPSGGLVGHEKSDFFGASLDEYVKNGGTLIVFAQPYGHYFSVLPVPEEEDGTLRRVNGYGWEEDQNCFTDAVYLDGWHQIFSGQSRSTPNMNVDGYFTGYPSSASVLLRRTSNGQPAMFFYPHGKGRVIVTSMYSDFAFGQSQASAEERAIIRDMISWAKKPTQTPEVKRGETLNITLDVVNNTSTDATSIKLLVYNPDRSVLLAEQSIGGVIRAHENTQVALQFAVETNAQLGIYHVDYVLLDIEGNQAQPQTETDSGRFLVGQPSGNPYKSPDFNFSATTSTELVTYQGDILFTIHAWNNTAKQRTVTAKYVFPHMYMLTRDPSYGVFSGYFTAGKDTGWLTKTITIGPLGKASFDHLMKNALHDEFIYINFYDEDNKFLGQVQRGFFLFHPYATTTLRTDKQEYMAGEDVSIHAEFVNKSEARFQATAHIEISDGSGRIVVETEQVVDLPIRETVRLDTILTLPKSNVKGFSMVHVTLSPEGGAAAVPIYIIPRSSEVLVVPDLSTPLKSGINNLPFTVSNAGKIPVTSCALQVRLQSPQGDTFYSDPLSTPLAVGQNTVLTFPIQIPALSFGTYALTYVQSDETNTGREGRIDIPNSAVLSAMLDKQIYKARDTATLYATIKNVGKFNLENIQVEASIPAIAYSQTQTINIPRGQSETASFSVLLSDSVASGSYDVNITVGLQSGSSLAQTSRFSVPESRLEISYLGSSSVRAGDQVALMIKNVGGVNTTFSDGGIELKDVNGVILLHTNLAGGSIDVGEQIPFGTVRIPSESASGGGYLHAWAKDILTEKTFEFRTWLDMAGIAAVLNAHTEKEYYKDFEEIVGISEVQSPLSFGIDNGKLDFEVYRIFASGGKKFNHFLPQANWVPYFHTFSQGLVSGSADGFVYVLTENRIFKFDAAGKHVTEWGSTGSEDGQFRRPRGLATGPDGSVYVADSGNYRIQKFDGNGNLITQWGGYGTDDGQFDFLRGIGVDGNGFVFVLEANRIQKFDSNGNFVSKWGSYSYNCNNADGFVDPIGIAVSHEGFVYVKDGSCGFIQKFDNKGMFLSQWGSIGTGDGQFGSSGVWGNMIAIGPDGSVYIADTSNNRIQKFDADGAFIMKWGKSGTEPADLNWPRAITFDRSGLLYTVEDKEFMHHIHRFDENGVYMGRWETYGSEEGQFDSPKGLALSPDGFLYIADTDNHRIQKFDKDGNFVTQWGSFGDDDEQMALPSDLAISPDGFLYIADTDNHRIQKFDKEGNFISTLGTYGSEEGQFRYPAGVAAGFDGFLYIADTDNHRIQKFDKEGNFISTLGTYGSEEGQFRYPAGVAAGFDGFLYIADTDNHRIQKFDKEGNFVAQWGGLGADDGMFIYPTRVTIGPDGCLYVIESWDQRSELSNDRIQKFDANGVFIAKWDNMILGNPRFYDLSGIAIGQDGTIYVADRHDSRVLKLDCSGKEALFRSNIPVNQPAGVSKQYLTDVGSLNISGKFYLEATLINSLGQRVAQSTYPFYIMKGNIYFTFSTDKVMYKPGETVIIQGEVRNLASFVMNGVSLVLTRKTSTGEEAIDSITFDFPSNGSFSFTSTAQAETEGAFILIGTLTHAGATLFEACDQYDIASPKVSCAIAGPEDVGNEPFTLAATVFNEGKDDVSVVLTSPFDSQNLLIPAGCSRMFLYQPQTITQDTLYTFTLSGDVNKVASKMVRYGLSANLTANTAPVYPQGNVSIPISTNNTGNLDGIFLIDVMLQPSGLSFQKNYIIPHGQTASDTLVFDLTEGDYTLTLTSQAPPASTRASFSVKKENNIFVAPIIISPPASGIITVSTELSNYGYNDVNGAIQLSILNSQGVVIWQSAQEVNLQANSSPSAIPVSLPFSQALLQSGSYTVKVAFLNGSGQELASKASLLAVSGASLRLAQIPSSQTVLAGEEAAFAFVVTNTGGKEASAELMLKSHDFINLTQRAVVNPGEEKSFSFAFPIPADLEEKDYYAEYELKDVSGTLAKGQVRYHVAGINISVAAALDKEHYREGENAHLALIINQQAGGTTRNLFARVNYGDFESKQSFALTGSQNLSFAIPLAAITGEKLFFGIYDEGGRSIHLNSLYIYKTGDAFTITTNKQVYNQGETVNMTIAGTGTGTMTISGPGGYSETFPFNGSATRSLFLPQAARAGTYHIEASLVTTEGQTTHATKPIDIAGISVKVKEAALDKGKYLPGEPLHLFLRIESNSNLPVTLKVWSVGPDKNSNFLGEQQFPLTRAEQVLLTTEYPATITASGIQKLIYGIYSDSMLLSSGNLSFDAGDGVILGMTTDRSDYPLGSEPVAVKLNVFGLTDATLTLKINGAVVHSETISLSGFSTISIPIPEPGPGAHTLEAVLTAGGLSSTKEISFLYGTNLSDIAADVWSSGTMIGKDGKMKLFATAGNRGKTIAIPTSMTLHDGDAMLATFPVGGLSPGASQSFEFLWNVIGKAGEHTLQAIIDPQNVLTEFTKDNNRVTRRIVIPDVALITETEKESYGMGEQVLITATSINLTAGTNYPNLTSTTIVRDPSGNEVFRQSKSLSLSPSQTGETTATWNTSGLTGEGKYTIRQEIATGATVIAERTKVITITAGSGFSLEVNPASVKVKQGETGHFTISVGAPSGWGGSVTLDAQGIPEGTTASFVPNIITGSGTSVVSVTTSATTPPGTYTLILRGQSNDGPGGTTQIIPTTLDVAGFSLQAVPESISIIQQETADFRIRATSLNDYTGAIVLSDTNGRIGGPLLTIDNPNLSVPGGETVVRVQSSKYVPPGTYTIKLSGSDGILSRDVTLSVGVTQNPGIVPGFVVTPGPGFDNRALVTLLNRNFVEKVEFTAFKTRFGANAVMGDIDGDGEDEIVVTPGPDPLADGRVKIFRQDGALLLDQPILTTKFGAYVTSGDIDGDWQEEVVVGAGPGLKNTARIKVLSFDGHALSNTGINFVAFPTVYKLGVKVALGDVDGDGIMEIIAGAGPSPLSPARVKVFKVDTSAGTGSWRISSMFSDFTVDFGDWYPYIFGVNVAAGDVDGDGKAEIIAGAGPNPLQKAVVAVYRGDGTFTGTRFEAYPSNEYRFGVNVTARDLDGDGVAEIITGPGPSPFNDSWIRVFRGDGTLLSDGFLAFPESTKFGAKVATGNIGE